MFLYDIVSPLTVKEAATDYQKRRQRERDVDAGKPVSRQAKNPQTDYAKKRARDKKELELGEEQVNELSKGTLANYVKANANDQVQHASSQSFKSGKADDKYNTADAWDQRTTKREKGMDRALNKLSQVEEDAWHAGDNAWSSDKNQWSESMDASEPSPVASAVTRRILSQRLDLLKQYGPELVGAAVDNVADWVGDVEEIGSSDVSAWVQQVERMLRENPPEAFRESKLNEFAPGAGDEGGGEDPYRYPKPESYRRSSDYFEQFEADHFDREDMDDATGVFKGYWGDTQIAYFKFDNPAQTGGDDPGMGWYYEPQNEGVTEGVNDPHTFKCIFLFGPMGAGKSTVARPLLTHTGLRSVNLDNFNELFVKNGQVPTGHLSPDQLEKSWQLTQTQQQNFINGRLGVIIDGSGRNPDTAIGVIEKLMPLGYEFMMIFVNVSEATSIARQQSRAEKQKQQWGVGRQVDPILAKNTYAQVQKMLGKYSAYFGPQRFVYVDNENTPDLEPAEKKVDAFLRAPITQPEAIEWIQSQKGGQQVAQKQQKLATAQDRQQQALTQFKKSPLNTKYSGITREGIEQSTAVTQEQLNQLYAKGKPMQFIKNTPVALVPLAQINKIGTPQQVQQVQQALGSVDQTSYTDEYKNKGYVVFQWNGTALDLYVASPEVVAQKYVKFNGQLPQDEKSRGKIPSLVALGKLGIDPSKVPFFVKKVPTPMVPAKQLGLEGKTIQTSWGEQTVSPNGFMVREENGHIYTVAPDAQGLPIGYVPAGQQGVAEAIPLDTLRSTAGTRVKDEVSAQLKQNGPLGREQVSVQQLATISDAALDKAYGYGRSTPGNTFGWQANLKSAAYAKKMIDRGVTDIETISDAIHKGWNITAQAFVKDPEQFDDSKTMAPEKLQAKIAQRQKLMTQNYAQLPNDEQEKDRVVARALLQAITGSQNVNEIKQRLDAKCWTGKHKAGTKIKGGVRVNNCVPNESANPAQRAAIAIAKKKQASLKEFAADGGGDSGNYFQALASAWYNGVFDTGSLQKGIKSQEDVERLLNRGIVCPDGVTRKLHIDYNANFDGVVISSDDYYEHADHDETDSRTGKPFGPYDYMEFGDDELDESAQWRDPKYKDKLYTQEKPDYNDTREYDRAMWNPKPKGYPGRKELPGGGEYDRTDPLVRGAGIGRSGIKNNILDRGKRKGLPSRDQITSLKQSIKDISGRHVRANLPEQGVAEGGYNDYDNNRKGFSRPGREDDEYHVPDPVEPQYNIKVNGQVINQQPFANRSEALTWAKRAVAAGKLDPKNATLSPINQVNELSNDKLASYKKAAGADASAADKRGDFEHGNKRFRGIVKATIKQGDNDAKKHVKESYWTKLENERNTKIAKLVNELKESIK